MCTLNSTSSHETVKVNRCKSNHPEVRTGVTESVGVTFKCSSLARTLDHHRVDPIRSAIDNSRFNVASLSVTIILLCAIISCIGVECTSFTSSTFSSSSSSSSSSSPSSFSLLNNSLTKNINGNCSSCISSHRNAARERRIEGFKNEILSKLGFKSEPKVNVHQLPHLPSINEIIGKLGIHTGINHNSDDDDEMTFNVSDDAHEDDNEAAAATDYEDFYVNTKRSITFAQKPPTNLNISNELKAQYFKFSPKIYNSRLTRANLWIHVKQLPAGNSSSSSLDNSCTLDAPSDHSTTAWIVVYQVIKSDVHEGPTLLHVKAQKISIPAQAGAVTMVKIDIKKLVSQWLSNPSSNLGLVIHSLDNNGCTLEKGQVDSTEKTTHLQIPFIEVRVDTQSQSRQRREVGLSCEEDSSEKRCCRFPLTIDFEEMGWNWIIAPRKYQAYYCSGECSASFSQQTHSHLVNQATFGRNNLCCIARKMSSISMLYYDEGYNINQGVLPGMVVEKCGCV